MEIEHFRHLWGVTDDYAKAFEAFREAGYTGVEALLFVPDERYLPSPAQRASFARERERSGLDMIGLVWTLGKTVEEHVASFETQYLANIEQGCRFVNSMGGRDVWSDEKVLRYYEATLGLEQKHGCPVTHEIHRSRPFFHPLRFLRLIDRFPEMKLCADFSHWVCACEGLLEDSVEAIRKCARQTWHLHTRVGHEEGPQVADPRAPEAERYCEAHECWWDQVWASQWERGMERVTVTPEFGPPPYMTTLPYTGQPVADLAAICDWQMRRQEARFKTFRKQRLRSGSKVS